MIEIQSITKDMLGVVAVKDIQPETLIRVFNPQFSNERNKYTIQIGTKHMMDDIGQYLNHSCNPNSEIRNSEDTMFGQTLAPCLYAIKDIKVNDEVTFDYNTTEETLSEPFYCSCHDSLIMGWGC